MRGRKAAWIAIAISLALAVLAVLLAVLLAPGATTSRPPPQVRILEIRRQLDIPVPPTTAFRGQSIVPLAIHIPRSQLRLMASHSASVTLEVFHCERPLRRFYGSDLYLEGVPFRRFTDGGMIGDEHDLLESEAEARNKGTVATIVAMVPRRHLDREIRTCASFSLRESFDSPPPARIPPPSEADIDHLNIVVDLVDRPAGRAVEDFAEDLILAEAARLGNRPIAESRSPPIAAFQASASDGRAILVYFDPSEPAERAGRICRVNSPPGGMDFVGLQVYRRCASRLGLVPAPRPPGLALVGPISHYIQEQSRWITCPQFGDCPELKAAQREATRNSAN